MQNLLFSWPDQLPSLESCSDPLDKIAILIRNQDFRKAESLLLVLSSQENVSSTADATKTYLNVLQFFLYSAQDLLIQQKRVVAHLTQSSDSSYDQLLIDFIQFKHALDVRDSSLPSIVSSLASYIHSDYLPFCFLHCEYYLLTGDYSAASLILENTLPNGKIRLNIVSYPAVF